MRKAIAHEKHDDAAKVERLRLLFESVHLDFA
jgi:hypothetical protein